MILSTPKQTSTDEGAVLPAASADPSPVREEPIDPAHRHLMIAEAAFFIAQARGFAPSQDVDDWLAAEREIEQQLSNPDH
jgi:hypothetical protein